MSNSHLYNITTQEKFSHIIIKINYTQHCQALMDQHRHCPISPAGYSALAIYPPAIQISLVKGAHGSDTLVVW